ncbi:MAG: HDIG domain-containing protein [Desulfobacterales bacterium]|nr:HDIG domain-containing protein [Desulfobacterales bacterium]
MTVNRLDKSRLKSLNTRKASGKRERDASPGGKKGYARSGVWFREEAKRWYILLGLSIIISVLLFPTILTPPKAYKLGDIADRDIKASQTFLIENTDLTEKDRQDVVRAVLSVYDFDPTATDVASKIKEAFESGRVYLANSLEFSYAFDSSAATSEKALADHLEAVNAFKSRFFEILDIPYNEKLIDVLIKNGFSPEAEESVIALATDLFHSGVVGNKMMLISQSGKGIVLHDIHNSKEIKVTDFERFYDLKSAGEFINGQGKVLTRAIKPKELAKASLELASALIKPNVTFNKRETALRQENARKSVKPFYFKVKKGEMLIREGERTSPEHLLKLHEQYKLSKQKEMLGKVPAMALLIAFLLSSMYVVGLFSSRSSQTEVRDLLFSAATLLLIFLVIIAFNFVAFEIARGFSFFSPKALLFAVPVASGAMLISIFHGIGVAASFSLIISVLACLVMDGRVEFFVYFFISSLVAASGVRKYREVGVLIKAGLKVSLCNMILALSIAALYGSFFTLEALIASGSALIGGVLVGVVATGILPLIEMSFGYTTDIKLLELANLDQPLLRELMVQAPGSYHHSVVVSNLVEASARAVNANPLLAKVAAYYHDIGKITKPLYFIENQGGRENKHEKLAPSMSSLVLISHVKDGVELAKKYKLGKEIIDIIRQHHGTSLITFFYEKAKEQGEKKGEKYLQVEEADFRYPGPKPQTKEAGLVMLGDVVEAASKTLVDPTAARIQGMVQKMINKIFSDGQLDECELTLKDLHEIAKSFNKTLSGIFHHRIEYPEPVARFTPSRDRDAIGKGKDVPHKKEKDGDTDQLASGTPRVGKKQDKGEVRESLKRLGLS